MTRDAPTTSAALDRAGLSVAATLAHFIEQRALPGTGVTPERFWNGLAAVLEKFVPENRALLAERDRMQASIDRWHQEHQGKPPSANVYQASQNAVPRCRGADTARPRAPGRWLRRSGAQPLASWLG